MKDFEKLAHDILAGKRKGVFVLRDGSHVPSKNLDVYTGCKWEIYPFKLKTDSHWAVGLTKNGTYFNKKEFYSGYDIIDFIDDTPMKEIKEVKIEIPEGMEIDKENSTLEKIVFKKKDNKPRSWTEYYNDVNKRKRIPAPTELSNAIEAFRRLMYLRYEWIGNWKPDYRKGIFIIETWENDLDVAEVIGTSRALSFPTEEIAEEFLNCFKDLINKAKLLI